MKRETLWETFEQYQKKWNMLQCIGDHPLIVKRREEREIKLKKVKELLGHTEDYESAKEFLEMLEFAKEIVETAIEREKFD